MRSLRIGAVCLGILMATAVTDAATVVVKKHSGQGLPEDTTTETWIEEQRIREDAGSRSFIADLEAAKVYVVDHADKSFYTLDHPVDLRQVASSDLLPFLDALESRSSLSSKLEPLEQGKEVGGKSTRGYKLRMDNDLGVNLTLTLWTTDKVDFDLEQYRALRQAVASARPMDKAMETEMQKVEGYPMLVEVRAFIEGNEILTQQEVVSIEQREAPEGTFAPPSAYRQKPVDLTALMPPRN